MENITQELLNELDTYQQRIGNISCALYEKALEVWKWENENLGTEHDTGYRLRTYEAQCVEVHSESVRFLVYDSWAYGGYEEKSLSVPQYKLFGDDWREAALKEYQDKLEEERKKKEAHEAECERKAEEREFAEYERLKTKFEGPDTSLRM